MKLVEESKHALLGEGMKFEREASGLVTGK